MKRRAKRGISVLIFSILALVASRFLNGTSDVDLEKELEYAFSGALFETHEIIQVDGGDRTGERKPNVAVDVGYGDREYWAFTNEYGQLVMVTAKEIILQDERREPVLSSGRYYQDEAYVPGTERKDYDQGHVIADSLGGVANAYNITPQYSYVNRKGSQSEFENRIRNNGGCTDFVCIISYPDTRTQIPDKYTVIYRLNGKLFSDEFNNGK